MTYLPYVIAAYTVFFVVLLADWLNGWLAVRRALTHARKRPAGKTAPVTSTARELER